MSGSSEATKQRLIEATVRLVAQHGVKGVSVRTITSEAGCKNLTAIHYHFGGKKQLVDAATQWFTDYLASVGEPGLAEIERRMAAGEPVAPRDVVQAWILPAAALVATPNAGPLSMRFYARILMEAADDKSGEIVHQLMPLFARLFNMFSYVIPDVPPHQFVPRIAILFNSLVYVMSDVQGISQARDAFGVEVNPLEALHYFIEYHAAGIAAPPSPVSPGLAPAALACMGEWQNVLGSDGGKFS